MFVRLDVCSRGFRHLGGVVSGWEDQSGGVCLCPCSSGKVDPDGEWESLCTSSPRNVLLLLHLAALENTSNMESSTLDLACKPRYLSNGGDYIVVSDTSGWHKSGDLIYLVN